MPTARRVGSTAVLSVVLVLAATACSGASAKGQPTPPGPVEPPGAGLDTATFAGGCFWCMEGPFEKLGGVKSVLAGYSGGSEASPTYEQVSAGRTGHAESVLVTFDPRRISYAELVEVYWRQVDPTDAGGQFADRGKQYRTTIFVHGAEQQRVAEASKQALAASGPFDRPIVTPIVAAGPFWPAEEYHQDFYKKEPERYEAYRQGSGRAPFLARVWGSQKPAAKPVSKPAAEPAGYAKPGDEDLRRRLTPLQYHVTQEDGTERAYANEYWDNKHVGIYVDVVSGEPLFSSQDKFDSGTGWPSFTRPLEPANVAETGDRSRDMFGVEVRSAGADSHLGHLFPDGPPPTRQRYCINSAALRFIPAEDLEREGYGKYSKRFK